MSYHTGQTFTFGEQPSATKWNYLWENDDALRDGTGVLWNNNQEIQAKNSSGTTKKFLRLDDDNYMRLSQLPFQADTSNSTREDVLIQHGWGQKQGNGAATDGETVTFPVAFSTNPIVVAQHHGYKNTSGAADINGFDQEFGVTAAIIVSDITTSGFRIEMNRASGAYGSGGFTGYSWIAIGTKA